MHKRVVVTGLGVLCPVGVTVQESWQAIISGTSGITKLDTPQFKNLPCQIAGLVKGKGTTFNLTDHFKKSDLKTMAPATGYALLAAKEAIEDSNIMSTMDEETKRRTGVSVGMGMIDLEDICNTNDSFKRGYNQVSPFFVPRILLNMAAGQISIRYGFRGPNHAVSTACASGAHSIGDSFNFIRHGTADVMICGGAEACVSPLSIAAFCRLRALSTTFNDAPQRASRPFDKAREGFVMGEGSAILVLEELERADRRGAHIYAEIIGYGLSGDASHLTAPSADGTGAILAMERAISDANIGLDQVTYVNAHATSTPIGDAIEVRAIRSLFGEHVDRLAVSSTKGSHGHLLGAAGNLESVFAIKAIEEGILPPTINLEDSSEMGDLNFVGCEKQLWPASSGRRVLLKNAFGFGGTNASLCLAQFIT